MTVESELTTRDASQGTSLAGLAMIGFGEAGQAFVAGLSGAGQPVSFAAYDIKTDDAGTAGAKWQDYAAAGVTGRASLAELLADADLVFSLVTADQARSAARLAAQHVRPGALFLDGNSCAPNSKKQNAALIDGAGGCYVDAAIMAPVHPGLHKTPILLSGAFADQAQARLARLGMNSRVEPGEIGRASSIKMMRSIMVKGMEALTAECILAGRRAGVADVVLESLQKSTPEVAWTEKSAYNLERMMLHGKRRAAEMAEVAQTVTDLGLDNGMAAATTAWQQRIGDLGLPAGTDDLTARADAILAALGLREGSD